MNSALLALFLIGVHTEAKEPLLFPEVSSATEPVVREAARETGIKPN